MVAEDRAASSFPYRWNGLELFTRNLFDSRELMNIYLTRVAGAACKRIVVLFFFPSIFSATEQPFSLSSPRDLSVFRVAV